VSRLAAAEGRLERHDAVLSVGGEHIAVDHLERAGLAQRVEALQRGGEQVERVVKSEKR
jgi:hypothetical protein